MLYWNKYREHNFEIIGKRKKFDNTIYTFDIETTSYLILNDKQISTKDYENLTDDEKEKCIKQSTMYIWQFGINDTVYYGRTWEEFKSFLNLLENNSKVLKYVFVHNLSFEFQYLKGVFHFEDVVARKSHKVMTALMRDYNIMFRCSYFMSNCALKYLPSLFNLPVDKKVGDLDYDLVRTSITNMTDKELGYCEYDCLVLYHYIKRELETYETLNKIPVTSTGKVRRELQELVRTDYKYKRVVYKAINTNPHIYNLLQQAFMGGYTHSNWIYTDEVIKKVDSFDETSAYPYVLVSCKFPSSEFKKCNIKNVNDMSKKLCYLLVVKFIDIECKYFNNFISASKCRNIKGGKYDNGRIIKAKELEITLTDIDFYFILDTYKGKYIIEECYYANYNYLPKQFINFVLEKYVNKTKYKDVPEKEIDYQKEKNKFNSLYGMSVTNTIRDNVRYIDEVGEWIEEELTNDDIIDKLQKEKNKSFLSFAYGVWCTAYARDNLLRRVIELDDHVIYCDTDSIKLKEGYNKEVFTKYNESVYKKIEFVSSILGIDIEKYQPEDIYGNKHLLGVFEDDGHYKEFITQGAKKYAVIKEKKNSKIKNTDNIIKAGEITSDVIEITVAGVPKNGSKCLNNLNEFKDDLIFNHNVTNKNILMYIDNQDEFLLTDYLGNEYLVKDKTGCCVLPTTYVLGKSLDYASLLTDNSSNRAIYKE